MNTIFYSVVTVFCVTLETAQADTSPAGNLSHPECNQAEGARLIDKKPDEKPTDDIFEAVTSGDFSGDLGDLLEADMQGVFPLKKDLEHQVQGWYARWNDTFASVKTYIFCRYYAYRRALIKLFAPAKTA